MIRRPRGRRGLTIIELLISVVVTALIGLAMLRTLRGTLLFAEKSERGREARSVARASLALVETDLSSVVATSVGTSAVEAASTTSITVRVPVMLGTLCNSNGTTATISLLPADSLTVSEGNIAGTAYRDAGGQWTYLPTAIVPNLTANLVCAANNVVTLPAGTGASGAPAGRVVTIVAPIPAATPAGSLVLLYRRLQYDFAPSSANADRTALWRRTLAALGNSPVSSLEMAGPFANTAAFGFYTGTSIVPLASVPADLRSIRGIELILPGESVRGGRDGAAIEAATVRTSVFFRNRTD